MGDNKMFVAFAGTPAAAGRPSQWLLSLADNVPEDFSISHWFSTGATSMVDYRAGRFEHIHG